MKIGFFTDTYLPIIHGVEISMETFRQVFEKMGHQVYIYAPHVPGYKDKNPNVFRFNSVKIVKEPEMRFAFPVFPQDAFKEASKFKIDIAHAHTPFSMGLLAKYIAKKQKIPMVYTHHTHYPEYAKVYFKEKLLLPQLAKLYCAWFANMADTIIAPSEKIKKMVRTYGVKKTIPIQVVLTGINLDIFKPSAQEGQKIKEKLNIPKQTKILLFVGRINKEKNVEFLIDVIKEISLKRQDFKLLMAGDGALIEELKEKINQLNISQFVQFVGKVPHKSVSQYYQAADLFCFPSLTDTQGIVLLEAMACGSPVVTLKDDAFFNVVKDNENGFMVSRQSVFLYAQKIIQLFDDQQLYKQFSIAAQDTAKKYSETSQAQKLIKIYQDLIDKKKV